MRVFCVRIHLNSLSVKMIDSQLLEENDKTLFSLLASLFLAVFIFLSMLFLSPSPPLSCHTDTGHVVHDLINTWNAAPALAVVVYHGCKTLKEHSVVFLSAAGRIKTGLISDKGPRLQSENSGYALYTS